LGKSPLLYQAGACVAAGLPFLGLPTVQGKVLYMDSENGQLQVDDTVTRVAKHLGLAAPPDGLLLWNLNDCPENFGEPRSKLASMVNAAQPSLVIIDPINSVFTDIENDSTATIGAYQELRAIMGKTGCSFVGVHHIRKVNSQMPPDPLDREGDSRSWFLQARGARALINGCDIRLGVDVAKRYQDESALVLRGFGRISGHIPLLRLARVVDADGDPIGYDRVDGVRLLTPDQRACYDKLPDEFRYTDARQHFNGDSATAAFLNVAQSVGVLTKDGGSKRYRKVRPAAPAEQQPVPAAA
jgi:hypothetical protein